MAHSRFYDSVFQELAMGQVQDGMSMLVGMLDTIDQRSEQFEAACDELRLHRLGWMLREDPLFAGSPSSPGSDSAMLQLIAAGELSAGVSHTGMRLFAVTSTLKFCRALRERYLEAGRKVARAWQQGRSICILGDGPLLAAETLIGRDLRNITVVGNDLCDHAKLRDAFGDSFQYVAEDPEQYLRAQKGSRTFDVICTTELPDKCATPLLGTLMPAMQRLLAPDGTIELAAITNLHPGYGWRRAYLDWEPNCHDADSLLSLAKGNRVSASVYHDETACILWCQIAAGRSDQFKATCQLWPNGDKS